MEENAHDLSAAAERAITTRFRKTIWKHLISAMKQYRMTVPGDRIAVCISGGKDSLLLAVCMRMMARYTDIPFEPHFLMMDPGYDQNRLAVFLRHAARLGIEPDVFQTDIFQAVNAAKRSPCHVCAAMRRGHLYRAAMERGCNKIALGHHFDDVIETVLLSMLYGAAFKTMMPRLKSENFPGMELIRPLYLVRERYIAAWQQALDIPVMSCSCQVTQREDGGKRREIKGLLAALEKNNPNVAYNIYKSTKSVNLSTLLSWREHADAPEQSFLDVYMTHDTGQ